VVDIETTLLHYCPNWMGTFGTEVDFIEVLD